MSAQSMAIKSKRTSKPARRSSRSSSAAKPLAQPVVKPTRNLPIQAKLTIGQPNDKYEQEANRVADQVMCMSDADVAQRVESGNVQPMRIQRMCPECDGEMAQRQPMEEEEEMLQPKLNGEFLQRQPMEEEEEMLQPKLKGEFLQRQPMEDEEEELQAKEMPGQTPTVAPNLESRINSLKGGGQPLDFATRSFFEPRFGHNFSNVRVHADSSSADTAKSINARAFTLGNHVVMGSGEYQPKSQSGQRLLGHELTHVVQQNGGASVGLQRAPTPFADTQDAWENLSADGRKKARSLYNDSVYLIGHLGDAQDAHYSLLRKAWIHFLGANLLVRINELNADSKLRGLINVLQDFKDGILRTVAESDTEWQVLEQRYLDEHRRLLAQNSTDATEAAKWIQKEYNNSKLWLERGAMEFITEEDYLPLKDTMEKGSHIMGGVLRSSRIRAKKLAEMLDTVTALRREGKDADTFVPGWSERVEEEAANLRRLVKSTTATMGTDWPSKFRSMRKKLLERKAKVLRTHKRDKSMTEKGVNLVSGAGKALVEPFIEATKQLIDLTQIYLHFSSYGIYEPKFVSDMAEAAEQGATTGDLLKGVVTGLIETPQRFIKAVEDDDWEGIGREAVNMYQLARTIKNAPKMFKKLPGLVAKTHKALRILKARRLAVQLNEPRLAAQAPILPMPTLGLDLPKQPAPLKVIQGREPKSPPLSPPEGQLATVGLDNKLGPTFKPKTPPKPDLGGAPNRQKGTQAANDNVAEQPQANLQQKVQIASGGTTPIPPTQMVRRIVPSPQIKSNPGSLQPRVPKIYPEGHSGDKTPTRVKPNSTTARPTGSRSASDADVLAQEGMAWQGRAFPSAHKHHVFPQELEVWFEKKFRGSSESIHEYTLVLSEGPHQAIHKSAKGKVVKGVKEPDLIGWNQEWKNFKTNHGDATVPQIFEEAGRLMEKYKVSAAEIVRYPKKK